MATLSDITEGHSKRISRMTQLRDARLQDAAATRDHVLRALPAARKLYDSFDAQLADARSRQLTTDAKAAAARASTLEEISDALAEALAEAHRARKAADTAAFEQRRAAEEEAEHEFAQAVAASPSQPNTAAAQKKRAQKLEEARKAFDAALAAAQDEFRKARDKAIAEESKGSRDADRAFAATTRISETSSNAARATAEQALAKALSTLPQAAEVFSAWRTATATIVADYKRSENEEFERFHQEVQALTSRRRSVS